MSTGLRLPSELRKVGCRLLHQQCWLWGHDVRRPAGNLLLQAGFSRVRPPRDGVGCSQYTLRHGRDRAVRLWGFGLCYTGRQSVYVNRFQFEPRSVCLHADVWQADALVTGKPPEDAGDLVEAVRWIAAYERSTLAAHGVSYRRLCLGGWKGKYVEPQGLPCAWDSLADRLEAATG